MPNNTRAGTITTIWHRSVVVQANSFQGTKQTTLGMINWAESFCYIWCPILVEVTGAYGKMWKQGIKENSMLTFIFIFFWPKHKRPWKGTRKIPEREYCESEYTHLKTLWIPRGPSWYYTPTGYSYSSLLVPKCLNTTFQTSKWLSSEKHSFFLTKMVMALLLQR